jgi:hypothetical protein
MLHLVASRDRTLFLSYEPKTDLHLGSESYLCAECLKGRKASVFIAVENLQAISLTLIVIAEIFSTFIAPSSRHLLFNKSLILLV